MKKRRIAVTGGIGSGKSYFANALKEMGFDVFSCDEIYKELACDKVYVEKIEREFGVPPINGCLDRSALSKIVFCDQAKLKRLNEIAHPLIMEKLLRKMDSCERICFAEVPLLFEGGYESLFDEIVVVIRDKAQRIAAVVQRDGVDELSVVKRMENQFDYDDIQNLKKLKNVTVLNNEGGEGEFLEKIKLFVKRFV